MRRLAVAVALFFPTSAAAVPAPSVVASTTSGPAPLTVRFTADGGQTDPGPAVVSYTWSFGDGATAAGQSVSHRFVKAGRYTVTVTVTDALGGTAAGMTQIQAQRLRLTFAPPTVVFGNRVVARGALVPAAPGARVMLERRGGSSWQAVTSARTDSAGRF